MISVKPYSQFSQVYSHLMNSVDYSFWANYISEIHSIIGKKNDIALELASGDCKLSKYFKNEFKSIYLTDISLEMLKLNRTKHEVVCCDMQYLPFNIQFDFIFSAFDSINYLNSEEILQRFFNNIKLNLRSSGYFSFDVALKSNSIKHLKNLNRKGTYKGIKYKQISEFDDVNNLHINRVEILQPDGNLFNEVHIQKIYDFYYYFEVLELAGFFVAECFDAFSFEDATPDSERVQFIVKRKQ